MATKFLTSTVTPTVTLDPYADGDVLGGLLSFDVSGLSIQGGLLNKVVYIDEDSQPEPVKLYLFNSQPSTIANDAAFAPTIADLRLLNTVISIAAGDYNTVNAFDYVIKSDINQVIHSTTNTLYGYLVASGGTPDYANVDTLQITLHIVSEQ